MVDVLDFVFLKDSSQSDPLFNGEYIVCHADSFSYDGDITLQSREKGFTNIELINDESFPENYTRRKSNVSFIGFPNPVLKVSGLMSEDSISADTIYIEDISYKVLTPTRLLRMAYSARTFFLYDPTLASYLNTEDSDGYRFFTEDGIPVSIEQWSMKPIVARTKAIEYNISFKEAK